MLNVNGSNDDFYRYKMDMVNVSNKGNGNGQFTIINNLDKICKTINTPPEILYKYIANDLGSSYNEKKNSLTGTHTQETIQQSIFKYINNFVICTKCGIPEINYSLKNKNTIESKCSACGSYNVIKNNNKINLKVNDLILKYLEKNKNWTVTKGNMVLLKNYAPETFGQEVDKLIEEQNKELDNELNEELNNELDNELNEEIDEFNPFN